jgi:pterin-4a-carbinolamine dehydratase
MQPFTFFISYRRQDTAPIALLLKSEIERRLKFVRVSVDVDEILPGDQFPIRLQQLIDKAHCTIALVGKHWLPRRGAVEPDYGVNDWVVDELEYSMRKPLSYSDNDRRGLETREVIPIFVDCEANFSAYELPKRISDLTSHNPLQITYAAWPTNVGALVDQIGLKLNLQKREDDGPYPPGDISKARTQPVGPDELRRVLGYDDYAGWYVDNLGSPKARYLAKTFEFHDFNQASEFMRIVSDHCRILDHHPEWRNVFKNVSVALTTWDAKHQVTIFDLSVALFMNKAARMVMNRK